MPSIVLTFDNLGEASELERGTWDGATPLGRHPSVTRALPRLLDELDSQSLRATFFVEAINCELNPAALDTIARRGHELGVHGWRHEPWAALAPEPERALLTRSTEAFAALGFEARAFRPPGGGLTAQTPSLLAELGYVSCSPAADAVPVEDGAVEWVPFDWELVDAYHLMDRFGPLRTSRGDTSAPLDAGAAADRIAAALTAAGTPKTVILHPFLLLDDAWWGAARHTLALVAQLTR